MRSIRTLMFRSLADASRDEFIGYLSKNIQISGAGDGVRTRDPELGKLVLYQLSYTRIVSGYPVTPPRQRIKLRPSVVTGTPKILPWPGFVAI